MTKRILIYCILSLLVLLSSACQSQLPKEVPNNLKITYLYQADETMASAGRIKQTTISGNQITVEKMNCSKIYQGTLSEREIERIYKSFINAEFDLIEDQPPANDGEKGFQEITIQAGNISKTVRKGQRFPLSEKSEKSFNSIWTDNLDKVVDLFPLGCN